MPLRWERVVNIEMLLYYTPYIVSVIWEKNREHNNLSIHNNCTLRSPEIFAPARMPVAAGKKTEKTPKKFWPGS